MTKSPTVGDLQNRFVFGVAGRNRTCDRQLRRLLLYPLSYSDGKNGSCPIFLIKSADTWIHETFALFSSESGARAAASNQ